MKSFRELIVWKRAMELVKCVYALTESFPSKEQFGLSAQMRRAAVSIPSNVAEGYVRSSTKEYMRFVTIAFGSSTELETQLEIAKMLDFGTANLLEECFALDQEVQRMLNSLRGKLQAKL
jgi:four helix bundle protein